MPDAESYRYLQGRIEEARNSMFVTKLKPLHSTRSFHSWRENIERSVDRGCSFSTPKHRSLPRKLDNLLEEVKAKHKLEDDQHRELMDYNQASIRKQSLEL